MHPSRRAWLLAATAMIAACGWCLQAPTSRSDVAPVGAAALRAESVPASVSAAARVEHRVGRLAPVPAEGLAPPVAVVALAVLVWSAVGAPAVPAGRRRPLRTVRLRGPPSLLAG
ncbi:MAG: hypothetical protein AB7O29_06230 [Acidimicrobiia bacterium]